MKPLYRVVPSSITMSLDKTAKELIASGRDAINLTAGQVDLPMPQSGKDAVIAALIYAAYYILLGFALSRFVGASYTNGVFDRMINVRIEGAQVGRGLYHEEDEEEEQPADESAEA